MHLLCNHKENHNFRGLKISESFYKFIISSVTDKSSRPIKIELASEEKKQLLSEETNNRHNRDMIISYFYQGQMMWSQSV